MTDEITSQLPPGVRARMARVRLQGVARSLLNSGMKAWEVRQSFEALTVFLERLERKRNELKEFMEQE
jgi:hypothetical protein